MIPEQNYEKQFSLATITTTILRLNGFCLGQTGWVGTRRSIHPLTPIIVISHPLSASSIYLIHGLAYATHLYWHSQFVKLFDQDSNPKTKSKTKTPAPKTKTLKKTVLRQDTVSRPNVTDSMSYKKPVLFYKTFQNFQISAFSAMMLLVVWQEGIWL